MKCFVNGIHNMLHCICSNSVSSPTVFTCPYNLWLVPFLPLYHMYPLPLLPSQDLSLPLMIPFLVSLYQTYTHIHTKYVYTYKNIHKYISACILCTYAFIHMCEHRVYIHTYMYTHYIPTITHVHMCTCSRERFLSFQCRCL